MHHALNPVLAVTKLFLLLTVVSFFSIYLMQMYECTKVEEFHGYYIHSDTPTSEGLPFILVLLTILTLIPLIPWLCIRNRKLCSDDGKNLMWKENIMLGLAIFVCVALILIMGVMFRQISLVWGYNMTKSFFCKNAPQFKSEIATERRISSNGAYYNCHVGAHEFHHFLCFITYWILVAMTFFRLKQLFQNMIIAKEITFQINYRHFKFAFGDLIAEEMKAIPKEEEKAEEPILKV